VAFHKDETTPQIETVKWIKNNLNEDETIAIDASIWVDLHEPGFINNKVYKNADWSWKIIEDPEIRERKLNDDWKNVSYIALTHEILKQMNHYDKSFLYKSLINSEHVISWTEGSTSHIDVGNLISTNGDWMAIYKVRDPNDIYLEESWISYKEKFIHSYGQVIDPQSGNTTSEAQSYALLRAVWMNDKEVFEGVWNWTKDHLQFRGDYLFSWLWGYEGDKETVLDPNSATDADSDIALALIFASKKFDNPKYLEEARLILSDIWDKETVLIKGRRLLLPSPKEDNQTQFLVNPSYLFPAAYRIFADVDSAHDWASLADDSYYFLNQFSNFKGNVKLLPNWLIINTRGEISSATDVIGSNADYFGFDSFRTYWKAALDSKWFGSPESKTYIDGPLNFFEKEYKQHNNFMAVYDLDGNVLLNFNNMSTLSGPFATFVVGNPKLSHDVYDNIYKYYFEKGEHQNSDNYYDQNWTWFSVALYSNKLVNLWQSQKL
jgi:endoglucanase